MIRLAGAIRRARTKDDAHAPLDSIDRGSYVYRITLSPDPHAGTSRLDLRAWAGDVMRQMGPAKQVAISHEHLDHRHAHQEPPSAERQPGRQGRRWAAV